MKKILLILLLLISGFSWGQGGGALCLYQDSVGVIVCNYYGNSGGNSRNDCVAEALASNPNCGLDMVSINLAAGSCASQIFVAGNVCISLSPPYNTISANNQTTCESNGGRWCLSTYVGFFNGNSTCGDAICAAALVILPISLISFEGEFKDNSNHITWVTENETDNDYYLVEHSEDGVNWEKIVMLPGAGNSTQTLSYRFIHVDPPKKINYYKLIQVDYDGKQTQYGPISIDNRENKRALIKTINIIGQEVTEDYSGLVINLYDDGTTEKIYK